jgi:hypothetical protein
METDKTKALMLLGDLKSPELQPQSLEIKVEFIGANQVQSVIFHHCRRLPSQELLSKVKPESASVYYFTAATEELQQVREVIAQAWTFQKSHLSVVGAAPRAVTIMALVQDVQKSMILTFDETKWKMILGNLKRIFQSHPVATKALQGKI